MTTSERAVVAALEQAICQRIGEPRYQLWFPNKTKFTWAGDELLVGVPNHFYQEWLKKQFADVVRAAAADVAGQPIAVKFVIDPDLFQAARREEQTPAAAAPAVPAVATRQPELFADAPEPAVARTPSRARPRSRRWHHLH